jgi:multidrug efflux pump subunit AcrB
MNVLEFPVRHFQFTLVIFAMLVALGLSSWSQIPRGEDPPIDFPAFTIVAVYPGASPADLERLVVRDVEERLDGLENLVTIESDIVDGVAMVFVEFEAGEDADDKYDEVAQQIAHLRPDLPADLAELTIERTSTLDVAILQLALVSETMPYHELDRLAERLEDRISTVGGVRTVERWGVPERRVEVTPDAGRLAQLGLPPMLLVGAIGGESADIPAGAVEAGLRRFNVRSSGSYGTIDEIRQTVVHTSGGQLVRVRDVADVRWGYADSSYVARFDGERAVFVTVTQQDGQNIRVVRDRVWDVLDGFEAELPANVRMARGFDQSDNVQHRLSRLGEDFAIALLLVLVTLMPLGLRAAGIVMLSIPLSLAIGLTLLHLTGFTINQLSIVGAVIALGLLVDDSIVVVENITRYLREGFSRQVAAIRATKQIAVAVVGSTATLIFAFVPLLMLPGGSGEFIRPLPTTVIYTVLASLFVSLTIIPWLASMLLPRHEKPGGNRVLVAFEGAIHRTYAPLLDAGLRRPWAALAVSGALVVGSLLLVPAVGFSLFPKAETPQFLVNVTAPQGSSLDAADGAARFAEEVMGRRSEVRAVFTSVGHDNPLIYYNVFPRPDDPRVAQLFVLLHEYDPKRTPAVLDSMRAELAEYPAARIELREFENGPPIAAPIELRVRGPDLDSLRSYAARVERILLATPGTRDVTNPVRLQRTDLRVEIDRARAGLLGIPTLDIDRTLRMSLTGIEAGVLREPTGDARTILVRVADGARPAPTALDGVYVPTAMGVSTPLSQLAEVRFESGVPEIQRVDRERAVTVTSFVHTGENTDRVTRAALAATDSIPLAAGYRILPAGEFASREESFGGMGAAVTVAIFMILAILVLEFRTFRSTLIVASVIPLGVMGGILALFLTGWGLSFIATIGFVALIGIEIKTSILLVDLTNQLREEGMEMEAAIRKAGEVRFFPIVLTSLTAIGGLLVLALGGNAMYAPLAWVIIGGLVSSTLLARVVTPVMYKLLAPRVGKAPDVLEGGPAPGGEPVLAT